MAKKSTSPVGGNVDGGGGDPPDFTELINTLRETSYTIKTSMGEFTESVNNFTSAIGKFNSKITNGQVPNNQASNNNRSKSNINTNKTIKPNKILDNEDKKQARKYLQSIGKVVKNLINSKSELRDLIQKNAPNAPSTASRTNKIGREIDNLQNFLNNIPDLRKSISKGDFSVIKELEKYNKSFTNERNKTEDKLASERVKAQNIANKQQQNILKQQKQQQQQSLNQQQQQLNQWIKQLNQYRNILDKQQQQTQKQQQQQQQLKNRQQMEVAKSARQRKQIQQRQEKFQLKLVKTIVDAIAKLPVVQKVAKVASDYVKLKMLEWASNKPKWVQKATLATIGLGGVETAGKIAGGIGGFLTQAMLFKLLFGGKGALLKTALLNFPGLALLGKMGGPFKRLGVAMRAVTKYGKDYSKAFKILQGGKILGSVAGMGKNLALAGKVTPWGIVAGLGSIAIDQTMGKSQNKWVRGAGGFLSGALGWGATGATIGAMVGGPMGALIGGVGAGLIGGIFGLLKGIKDDTDKIANDLNKELFYTYNSSKPTNVSRTTNPSGGNNSSGSGKSSGGGGKGPTQGRWSNTFLNLNKPEAEKAVSQSPFFEKIANSDYWRVDYNSFITDVPYVATGFGKYLLDAFKGSDTLNKMKDLRITSGTSSKGAWVPGKGYVNTPHSKEGFHPRGLAVDIAGTTAQMNTIEKQLDKRYFNVINEGDHLHVEATQKLIELLEYLYKNPQSLAEDKPKDPKVIATTTSPDETGRMTKDLIGYGVYNNYYTP